MSAQREYTQVDCCYCGKKVYYYKLMAADYWAAHCDCGAMWPTRQKDDIEWSAKHEKALNRGPRPDATPPDKIGCW